MAGKSALYYDLEKSCLIRYKAENPGAYRKAKVFCSHLGLHCIAVYRFGNMAVRIERKHRVIGRLLLKIYLAMNFIMVLVHQVEINAKSEIGPGFNMSHTGGVFIGACRIGENCTITHNVTIGLGFKSPEDLPIIGNDVWIGTGSVLCGRIAIGDGATISAGSIVTRDVPPRSLVAGNPARVICQDYDNSHMLVYKMKREAEATPIQDGPTQEVCAVDNRERLTP